MKPFNHRGDEPHNFEALFPGFLVICLHAEFGPTCGLLSIKGGHNG